MALRNSHGTRANRVRSACERTASELSGFSTPELAAMNKVLLALLHAPSLFDLLKEVHSAVATAAPVYGSAYYIATGDDRLELEYSIGDSEGYLPGVLTTESVLTANIRAADVVQPVAHCPLQGSLFGDEPVCSFFPSYSDDSLAGVFAAVHGRDEHAFVDAVWMQVAMTADLSVGALSEVLSSPVVSGEPAQQAGHPDGMDRLTAREKEVLALLCQGLSNKEIAERLFISVATCKHHVESIMDKLDVHTRAAVVAVGLGRPRILG